MRSVVRGGILDVLRCKNHTQNRHPFWGKDGLKSLVVIRLLLDGIKSIFQMSGPTYSHVLVNQ